MADLLRSRPFGALQVKSAVQQLKKLLQEATLESDDNKRPLFSKYTV